jgi:putative transposase
MTQFDITLQDRLLFKEKNYRFEGRRGRELDFVSDRSGERQVFTDLELAEAIADGRAKLLRQRLSRLGTVGTAAPIADITFADDSLKADARVRRDYVAGIKERFGEGPISNAAFEEAVREIAITRGGASPPSPISVRRWVRKAGDRPTLRKLIARESAKGNSRDRLHPQVRSIIESAIDNDYLKRPPISKVTLHELIRSRVNKWNEVHSDILIAPSIKAVKAAISGRDPAMVKAARYGKAAAQGYEPSNRQADPVAPLDRVELDHTTADLFVVDEITWLPIGRPTIAFAIDRCTRMPFGLYVGFEPPSVHTVMQCLRNGMLPKLYLDRKVKNGEWEIKHPWPVCGRPRVLVMDRAMENLGEDMKDFVTEVGIDPVFMPRKKPWYKGAIERMLKSLNKRLLHEQRGTTFSNVLDRDDYDPAKNAIIPLADLRLILHKWLLDVYSCSEHKGVRDVPQRLWRELTEKYPVDPIESIEELDILLGKVDRRRLTREGLQFEYLRYFSEELVLELRNPKFLVASPDRFVRFRYNPGDLACIRAHLPHLDKYITVPVSAAQREYATGLSIWQHRVIVKFRNSRTKGAVDFDGIASAKAYLSEYVATILEQRRGSKTKVTAARFAGVGRFAPAGDDDRTSPEGSLEAFRRQPSLQSGIPPPPQPAPPKRAAVLTLRQEVAIPEGMRSEDIDLYAESDS